MTQSRDTSPLPKAQRAAEPAAVPGAAATANTPIPPDRHRLYWGLGVVLAVLCFGIAVYVASFRAELDQAAQRGRSDLTLAADRLAAGLQRYREAAVFLADHPIVLALVQSQNPGEMPRRSGDKLLQEAVDKTGAQSALVLLPDGDVLAAAGGAALPNGAQAMMQRAMNGALGRGHVVDASGRRLYIHAAPIFTQRGKPKGMVLMSVDIGLIEWGWPTETSAVFFTDADDVVVMSNRSELVLLGGQAGPFPLNKAWRIAGHEIWHHAAGPYVPTPALYLQRDVPVIGLKAGLLMDLAPVRGLAGLQAGMASALALIFGMLLLFVMERRRTLAIANARLEARVAKRTQALEIANRDLMREVAEREEAEAQLKRAQADLVQAGKLSALGEMSAGISHELNQPLMAIRSFSENAQAFLARENPEKAAENLGRISELSRRMGRIIKNLRAFARQEKEMITDVEINGVIDAALEMTQAKISAHDITVSWTPGPQTWVRGGEVRLQQVVMNLISNAADAMAESAARHIEIEVTRGDPTTIAVRDTGPGILEPEKIFDPFYTTKEVGAAAGLGLGLSISYGLIQSFGGRIRGVNRHEGGAEFSIELRPAAREVAAE